MQTTHNEISESGEQEINKFSVEIAYDQNDKQRRKYVLPNGSSVIFRSRNEFPICSDAPRVLTQDELPHSAGANDALELYVEQSTNSHEYVANATPVGLIDLLNALRADDGQLPVYVHERANLLTGTLSEKETALLDMIGAALVDAEGEKTSVEDTPEGFVVSDRLMTVVQALNGDEVSRDRIDKGYEIIQQAESGLIRRELGDEALGVVLEHDKTVSKEALQMAEGMILVRTTANDPRELPDGSLALDSAAKVTRNLQYQNKEGYVPRETVHFTLNHKVKNHVYGQFTGRSNTVVAPLPGALEANGRPKTLLGVDTYFLTSPGESVVLPNAVVVKDGGDQKELVKQDGKDKLVKSRNFSAEDIDTLLTMIETKGLGGVTNAKQLHKMIETNVYGRYITESGIMRSLYELPDGKVEEFEAKALRFNLTDKMTPKELLIAIGELPHMQNEAEGYNRFDAIIADLVQQLVVDQTIIEEGGQLVRPDGMSIYIEDETFSKAVNKLASELGSGGGLHMGTPEFNLESSIMRYLGEDDKPIDDKLFDPAALPHRLRRMAILDGALGVVKRPTQVEEWELRFGKSPGW